MTTPDVTLAGWLLEQIAADEAAARAAQEEAPTPWWDQEGTLKSADHTSLAGYAGECASPHIARHDPARVLAECEAKRRIVAMHHFEGSFFMHECVAEDGSEPFWSPLYEESPTQWCPTLRLLAVPYADRPGYDESWRP